MAFWTYMLRCNDGSYYVGHTDNLDRRIAEHRSGFYTGYTYKRRPVTLVWSQDFAQRHEAQAAEKQIKGWGRPKEEALIRSDWEAISLLAKARPARSG
ncbi:GIY-YIG nuclease family protein [Novosphingopyxis baekryungensis]|uniref:GIY-YIG nuclease family protein n=1 Tax=Novosphingopyxis baekryungensis TaxID=279369 RepID=UPI0003B33AA2